MKALLYGYRNGEDVLTSSLINEITDSLAKSDYKIERYSIGRFREELLDELKKRGWSDNLFLDTISKISITSEKKGVGLCLQTGNVSRTYADMLKLQNLFVQGKLRAGVIIVPTSSCAKEYASNSATYERLVRELQIFSQVITMPLVVLGFYN